MENNIPSIFPTGRNYVSFSEIKSWKECPFKHKLSYVDKLKEYEDNIYLSYGTILHDSFEEMLKNKIIDFSLVEKKLIEEWTNKNFDSEDYINKQKEKAQSQQWEYKHVYLDELIKSTKKLTENLFPFLDSQFQEWKTFAAELELNEEISNTGLKFYGYVDAILEYKVQNKRKIIIVDWKTAGSGGWSIHKRRDFKLQMQLILYKIFFSKKYNIPMKDINCAFITAKRSSRSKNILSVIKISSGPKSVEKAEKILKNMINSVNKKLYLKNKDACRFCEYKNTKNCP